MIGIGDKEGANSNFKTYGTRFARYPNGQLVLTKFDEEAPKKSHL